MRADDPLLTESRRIVAACACIDCTFSRASTNSNSTLSFPCLSHA